MDKLSFKERIKKFRNKLQMSQLDLEITINASPGSISRIENGKINPTKETLHKIADALCLNCLERAELLGVHISYEEIENLRNYLPESANFG